MNGAYRIFEVIAWPAAAVCAIEVALRLALGERSGVSEALLLAACAAGMGVLARGRRGRAS